ncbi:Kynureninase (L-kynurenine hydrolase) [Neophaeococcomyces mojaviensis]|uniref:Kynureninase (L-kynurenine hydrolase) n=1 Tax=Neophaeococcomyces mojaviensis TaxID=3383035 RepID=A0ACC3ABB4_9EURO|nr:Kynureninase (L-kynurenine hydrolase) [Knufia sp. JES_112]
MSEPFQEAGHGEEYLDISHALKLDGADPLASFRSRFHIPTKADLKRPTIAKPNNEPLSDECIYLCGNSLGLQPKSAADLVQVFLTQWRTKAVTGHFVEHIDSPLAPFLHIDDDAAKLMAPIVGAETSEVAVMGTLTANLHLLMCSFYRPAKKGEGRYKILLEGKAFPSDHYAIESQIQFHGLDPKDAMVLLEPEDQSIPILTTERILQIIDQHAHELALILLPGIQFYTGQYFDIKRITEHAHSHNILIGWDCAHAAGNVDLKLHDWNVDFAAWCSYKYLNSGPGAMAAIFVHENHGHVDMTSSTQKYTPRLTGWWGDDKSSRFQMTNNFVPRPGAAGFQLSNPSALDLSAVVASLQIFKEAGMSELRQKSLLLTQYLEDLLTSEALTGPNPPYRIISPREPAERGAQLSLRLESGLLDTVLECLEEDGVVIDERKPDVIRVAPAPLYNSFVDVYQFCRVFRKAVDVAVERKEFKAGAQGAESALSNEGTTSSLEAQTE